MLACSVEKISVSGLSLEKWPGGAEWRPFSPGCCSLSLKFRLQAVLHKALSNRIAPFEPIKKLA